MTAAQLNDRPVRLETRFAPPARDPGLREAEIAVLARLLNGIVNSLNRGEPPRCQVTHAIVAHDGDVGAAVTELLERHHGRRDR
jgi:hypothetical protein